MWGGVLGVPMARREFADRFWDKVDKTTTPDGCWEWVGSRTRKGYGLVAMSRYGTSQYAHRIAWMLFNGDIPRCEDPRGFFVCHHCDNPPCIRPDHLFLGTNLDNMKDMYAKGRGAVQTGKVTSPFKNPEYDRSGEGNGRHRLNKEQVLEIRAGSANGGRSYVRNMAVKYGVSKATIRHVTSGYTWGTIK